MIVIVIWKKTAGNLSPIGRAEAKAGGKQRGGGIHKRDISHRYINAYR